MPPIDWLAVLLCGASSMVLGAIWYSPLLFGRAWQREAGITDAALAGGNMPLIYGGALALSLIAAAVFALFLGPGMGLWPSVGAGAAAGLGWVGASFGINYLFERRSLRLALINGGYHTLQFIFFGLILGLLQ
ncbi:MAG TPA: DUF1761 domain-containing protein [Allosphingosinicella sp.]|nr:DUF1761 domain-containing protein [Allosphingosinicella sp.]